jgi:hypothetical protein
MRYWWVNENQTYREELRGNFMWSPKANANGARNQFYENMREVAPGDIVFSFYDGRIQAIGIVTGAAQTAPKPDFGSVGLNWCLKKAGSFRSITALLRRRFDRRTTSTFYVIFCRRGIPHFRRADMDQSVYLAEVPASLADALIALMKQSYYDCLATITAFPSGPDVEEFDDSEVTSDIAPTFKEQVVKARRGQGVFRSSVLLTETECRVTRVWDPKHLRASHIKPWRDATDSERLNGSNGLLLSPHIDHLFDQGYISFSNSEQLLMVPRIRTNLLDKWGIDSGTRVGTFNREQQAFLDYHRVNVFKG